VTTDIWSLGNRQSIFISDLCPLLFRCLATLQGAMAAKNDVRSFCFLSNRSAYSQDCINKLTFLLTYLLTISLVKKYPFFMESQKPTTGPYPEPAKSSLSHRSLSP